MEYKGYLIEAFEERPRRWFANVRRLDGQAIPGMKSHSLRTSSVRFSKVAAIEFAKKVIDAGKIVREARVASEPEALLQVLTNTLYRIKRVGLEAGDRSKEWCAASDCEVPATMTKSKNC